MVYTYTQSVLVRYQRPPHLSLGPPLHNPTGCLSCYMSALPSLCKNSALHQEQESIYICDEGLGTLSTLSPSQEAASCCSPQPAPSLPDPHITQEKLEILILYKISHVQNVTLNLKRKKKKKKPCLGQANTTVPFI